MSTTQPRHTNRLAKATSPYLLQHSHNPVNWYEWGEEAFAKAKADDKPIFLSIGYAACHWCHVMEHESFETDEVAGALNGSFVSIKVDREERPDIDEMYMAYTQALTRGGGWPMSVWLTPDGAPFHAGTYFPRVQFVQVLNNIAAMWADKREEVLRGAAGARNFLDQWAAGPAAAEGVTKRDTLDRLAMQLTGYFDRTLGGISGGGGNKFPPSMAMDLMLRVYRRTHKPELFEAVDVTLDHMARGGIYDHLGGGICRYSTDQEWLVPHFEKMLYDQALVAAIYLDGFQVSKNPRYAAVAGDIFDYVLTDLRSPESGFYSSRDADSEGLEGKFYLWTVEQVVEALGTTEGELCCKYFDVTTTGNWFERMGHAPKGPKNILRISKSPEMFAKLHGLDVAELEKRIRGWREKLLAVRSQRIAPGLDDKILTDWNGLMIASLAKGARVLSQPRYAVAAGQAADFVLGKLQREGRLLRTYRQGEARLPANFADYAFFIEGLLNLHEATFEARWLAEAARLSDIAATLFNDAQGGGFFFTASDAERLLVRSKHPQDGAIPSGNSVHAMNLLRLAILLDRKDFRAQAESIFRAFAGKIEESPGAYERLCCALDFHHDRVKEIAVIGDIASADTQAMLRTAFDGYLPNKIVVHAADKLTETPIALLRNKGRIEGKAAAYVCENYRCQLPVTSAEELGRQLEAK